jgi:hypothetical protein
MNEGMQTGARRRQQILNTNKQVMIYVAVAAAVVTVCVMLTINFWQRISYQLKVNGEWSITNDSLKDSIANIPTLRDNVEALSANSNIKSIKNLVDPELEKWQVVFDVLPSSCDTMAVEYAFLNMIFKPSGLAAGVKDAKGTTEGGIDCDALGGVGGSITPELVALTVNFELVNATDDDIWKVLLSMEYSLHPITVESIEIDFNEEAGTRSAKFSVSTYFMPKAIWQSGEKTIPVDENAPAVNNGEEVTE